MTMTLELSPEVQAGLLSQARQSGLSLEAFAELVLREKSRSALRQDAAADSADAVRRLATFGQRHNLSLGDISVKDLLRFRAQQCTLSLL